MELLRAVMFGLLVGLGAFWATTIEPEWMLFGPIGLEEVLREPGHDPFTGRPFGPIITVSDAFMDPEVVTRRTVEYPPPEGYEQAIPLPVGWLLGSAAWLLARRRMRRTT